MPTGIAVSSDRAFMADSREAWVLISERLLDVFRSPEVIAGSRVVRVGMV
jgi:hypothetical protein